MSQNIYQKLAEIRTEINITKTGKHTNFNYYEINKIYAQVKDLFRDRGIFTTFSLTRTEHGDMRGTLTVINTANPEDRFTMSNDSPLSELRGTVACQNAGANKTYQSKYAYLDLLLLDDGASDPDKTNTSEGNTSGVNNSHQGTSPTSGFKSSVYSVCMKCTEGHIKKAGDWLVCSNKYHEKYNASGTCNSPMKRYNGEPSLPASVTNREEALKYISMNPPSVTGDLPS